jgi:hypothetical protein
VTNITRNRTVNHQVELDSDPRVLREKAVEAQGTGTFDDRGVPIGTAKLPETRQSRPRHGEGQLVDRPVGHETPVPPSPQ